MKRAYHLLPALAIRAVSHILAIGADKHGRDTWRALPLDVHLDAGLSHIFKWLGGERIDPDTGYSHLWNAATRLLFCVELEMTADSAYDTLARRLEQAKTPPERL